MIALFRETFKVVKIKVEPVVADSWDVDSALETLLRSR